MICDYRPWILAGIRDFRPAEFGPPENREAGVNMDVDLVRALQSLRDLVQAPIMIHRNGGYSYGGHTNGSLHYQGLAVDFHVLGDLPVRDQLRQVLKIPLFGGIGHYPEWDHPGFHLDKRSQFQMWVQRGGVYTYLL